MDLITSSHSTAGPTNTIIAVVSLVGLLVFLALLYGLMVCRRNRNRRKAIITAIPILESGISNNAQMRQLDSLIGTAMTVFNHERFVTSYLSPDNIQDVDFTPSYPGQRSNIALV